ncbi:hypothetical protein EJ08DRAFT_666620 [Tothia fuscella]|uniref:chitinase n=1 Tax=Tothia fuscella TaxID=1048955 RepID=A0A9P4NE45_9PEZI|nr:hypothetical protein EJ08DRAFT_666620 [Tothia fuscella]
MGKPLLCIVLLFTLVVASPARKELENTCTNPSINPFDHSVKDPASLQQSICPNPVSKNILFTASASGADEDDYTCGPDRPCRNGACCEKASNVCKFGPQACGTNGQSPNDNCWSNCDAFAECGKYAKTPGLKCPLNVCCSQYGFCGMKADFCQEACQSNCEQPGSGASGGDVQKRIIGYYEGWKHDQACAGMGINDIPFDALTHVVFSFGYISPGDYNVVPMDNLPAKLFADFTKQKEKNRDVKYMIALGGWTFNDNFTATQPVFHDIVSSPANRAVFISNLISFLKYYAFDGVDIDWVIVHHVASSNNANPSQEYPGARDRGGHPEDGVNFTIFLKELRGALDAVGEYVVSFTIPTSYWYLRHFDLAAVDHVDFVNIMSYDLHGVWDGDNPIGRHVWAHTNLTEIKEAMDLLWRNNVPASKLNLGIGFYGRSFELDTPGCDTPGCGFKSGAQPGPCSDASGVLSFREIRDIISQKQLTPYHDEANAIKYIVWDQTQWVSYDDEETIRAKIDLGNKLGLGGLLIWAIDQDDDELTALNAVIHPKTIKATSKKSDWNDLSLQDCYVTECGGKCDKVGFLKLTEQPCGKAKAVTRRSSEKNSQLCCPAAAMPDAKKCTWRGEAPSCNGRCHDGEAMLQMNRWGNGKYCEDGNKAYCCQVPESPSTNCRWTGLGQDCDEKKEAVFSFSGTFLSSLSDVAKYALPGLAGSLLSKALGELDLDARKLYCCPKDYLKEWKNCRWYGKPGSCFDNHCPAGRHVQFTDSPYGLGESCFPRMERNRVFCCEPQDGKSKFLPVPLKDLFPNPPQGDDVKVDHELKVDTSKGSGKDTPNEAPFGFYVLASPGEIQTSVRRDHGSHWDVFNCKDAHSEEMQTVQMVCTDTSENSNCGKISRGRGVPGTILEMPDGCGPSKYAVARSMVPSENQTLPLHLRKRSFTELPVVYDLQFDYEWSRVPQEYGETQLRVDFSNEEGYWDNIVAAAADKSRKKMKKRSLDDVGGNHKRWLEEEWRDDYHLDKISLEHLHKRWFGKDVIDWLSGFLGRGVKVDSSLSSRFKEKFTAILLHEKYQCQLEFGKLEAILDVRASASVDITTTFDLSQSFLYFKNKGEIEAIFRLDAKGKAVFDSGNFELANVPIPGAGFRIPKILSVGPSFRLYASANAEVNLAGSLEARVKVAKWDIYQTYPIANEKYEPDSKSKAIDAGVNKIGLVEPSFDARFATNGNIEAHLKPALSFGIEIHPQWKVGGNTKVELLIDSYVRVEASAEFDNKDNSCPFQYGIFAGGKVVAQAEAPERFRWGKKAFELAHIERAIVEGGSCPKSSSARWTAEPPTGTNASLTLLKRDKTYGPVFRLPRTRSFCPEKQPSKGTKCEEISGDIEGSGLRRRSPFAYEECGDYSPLARSLFHLFKRDRKDKFVCGTDKTPDGFNIKTGTYHNSGQMRSRQPKLKTFTSSSAGCTDYTLRETTAEDYDAATYRPKVCTEHVLEWHLLTDFFDQLGDPACDYMLETWVNIPEFTIPTYPATMSMPPAEWVGAPLPATRNNVLGFQLLEGSMNNRKEKIWQGSDAVGMVALKKGIKGGTSSSYAARSKALKSVRDVILAVKYMQVTEVNTLLVNQAAGIRDMLHDLETVHIPPRWAAHAPTKPAYVSQGLKGKWETYMRRHGATSATKVKTLFTDVDTLFKTEVKRLSDMRAGPPPKPEGPDERSFRENVAKLSTELGNMKTNPWTNPFANF